MLKFQYHWWALICTITSGFCGIVSVVTSVVNAATPTTTRMIAGITVHKASRRGLFVVRVARVAGSAGGTLYLRVALAIEVTAKSPLIIAGMKDSQNRCIH